MMAEPFVVPATHDDGRRILVGPVHSREAASRLITDIARLGWHSGEPVPHMTRAAWFTMAYRERKAAIDGETAALTGEGENGGAAAR